MKKLFGILAIPVMGFLLTGCGADKMTCTKEQDFGKAKITINTTATFKKDYLVKEDKETIATFESEEMAKSYVENYEGKEGFEVKRSGVKVTIKNTVEVDEATKDADENKKDNYKVYMEKAGNKCK